MAINVNTVYQLCQFIANKEQSGFFKPKDYNLVIPVAQMNVINELIAKDSQLQAKRTGALPSMSSNFKIDQELKDIVEVFETTVTDNEAEYPNDMLYLIKANHNYISGNENKVVKVKLIDITREDSLVNSYITPPTAKHPLGVYYKDFLKIYPSTVQTVSMTYLKKPIDPSWAITEVNGLPTYDSVLSVDFILNPNLIHKLITKILSPLGVNLSEERVIGYANQVMQKEEL